jgi:hypothetical protein
MKKILLITAVVALFSLNANAQKFWNFSEESVWGAGTVDFTTQTTIDGLTINATSSGVITIDANNKSIDDYSFTKRLKLGGTGTPAPDGRNVSFLVTGPCKITVYGMASSSGATDRSLIIHDGTTELYREILLGDKIYKQEYDYTGGAATLYLYSSTSGLNFYGIKVDDADSNNELVGAAKEIKSVEYFDITGRTIPRIETVRNSLIIKRTNYTDGTFAIDKFIRR